MKILVVLLASLLVLCRAGKLKKIIEIEELIKELNEEEHLSKFNTARSLDSLWTSFKTEFGKEYSSEEEELERKEIFSKNVEEMKIHNLLHEIGLRSFTIGVNQFSDRTLTEVTAKYTGFKNSKLANKFGIRQSANVSLDSCSVYTPTGLPLPDEVNWITKGYVTPVKDQGECGSCWAFSTSGAVEGQYFCKTGKLVSLSEQFLVECCGDQIDSGCDGGLVGHTFDCINPSTGSPYVGMPTEDCYPYEGTTVSQCHINYKRCPPVASVTGCFDVPPNEDALKDAVANVGPIAVAIDANHASFMSYQGGYYDEYRCSSDPDFQDHAVLVVGYGSDGGRDYWIIKNSWNTTWGQDGFMMLARNDNNRCGVADYATFPVLADSANFNFVL